MAELCAAHPKRFPAFVAAVSLDDVDTAMKEAERAITTLGARGIQIFTNIAGHPLDEERFKPVFAALALHDLPVWLHPARTATDAGLCGGGEVTLRDVVVLRLAV
jgi:aminocarboxymuconate-semialdehyde decarboxylase